MKSLRGDSFVVAIVTESTSDERASDDVDRLRKVHTLIAMGDVRMYYVLK
jgi:hypothetical protein